MKNRCLENYGVSKLETQEAKAINGGGWGLIKAIVSVAIVIFAVVFASNNAD
ncbi:MAG: hypothetical protein VW080_03320 [Flavobacteriaceae bacterium]